MTREEAIEKLKLYDNYFYGMWGKDKCRNAFDVAIEALQAEPAKHGKWEKNEPLPSEWQYKCSECGVPSKSSSHKFCPNCGAKMDKAIKAIEALTKPNNTCEVDLISREDVMGAVQDHFNANGFKGYYDGQKMMDRITALPSAEAVQGEWIDVENEPYCECSVCGAYIDNLDDGYAFCPRCGADMRGDKE